VATAKRPGNDLPRLNACRCVRIFGRLAQERFDEFGAVALGLLQKAAALCRRAKASSTFPVAVSPPSEFLQPGAVPYIWVKAASAGSVPIRAPESSAVTASSSLAVRVISVAARFSRMR
jgi:hypothetical protein